MQYLFAISSQSTENAGDFITKMLATAYSCNCNHIFNGNLCLTINLLNSIATNCTIYSKLESQFDYLLHLFILQILKIYIWFGLHNIITWNIFMRFLQRKCLSLFIFFKRNSVGIHSRNCHILTINSNDHWNSMIVLIQLKSIKYELGPVIELNANKNWFHTTAQTQIWIELSCFTNWLFSIVNKI